MLKKRGELEAQRIAQWGPPKPLRRSKAARPAAHRFTTDFTDEELSRVLKCVSCGDRWTVRKGATAKMRHIQSCAKKNDFNDDMIKRLIRAELEAPEEPKPRKKSKPSGVSSTLFEDALGDPGKTKNKRKPAQLTTTLHNPVDNREAIRAKARSLLALEISDLSQDQELVDILNKSDSRMDRIEMFDFGDPPPATQNFGPSKLGQQTSSALLSGLSDGSPKVATTSRLVGTAKGRTGEDMDSGSVSIVVPLFEILDNKFQPILVHSSIDIPFGRLSLGPQSDHGTEVSWYNDSAILHYNQNDEILGWDDNNDFVHDDAILHFDPGESLDRPLPPTNPVPTKQVKGRKTRKPRSRKEKADVESTNPIQFTEVDDTELKSKMLDAIRQDDELYHRILRYEVCTPLPHFLRTPEVTQLTLHKHSRSLWKTLSIWP